MEHWRNDNHEKNYETFEQLIDRYLKEQEDWFANGICRYALTFPHVKSLLLLKLLGFIFLRCSFDEAGTRLPPIDYIVCNIFYRGLEQHFALPGLTCSSC